MKKKTGPKNEKPLTETQCGATLGIKALRKSNLNPKTSHHHPCSWWGWWWCVCVVCSPSRENSCLGTTSNFGLENLGCLRLHLSLHTPWAPHESHPLSPPHWPRRVWAWWGTHAHLVLLDWEWSQYQGCRATRVHLPQRATNSFVLEWLVGTLESTVSASLEHGHWILWHDWHAWSSLQLNPCKGYPLQDECLQGNPSVQTIRTSPIISSDLLRLSCRKHTETLQRLRVKFNLTTWFPSLLHSCMKLWWDKPYTTWHDAHDEITMLFFTCQNKYKLLIMTFNTPMSLEILLTWLMTWLSLLVVASLDVLAITIHFSTLLWFRCLRFCSVLCPAYLQNENWMIC